MKKVYKTLLAIGVALCFAMAFSDVKEGYEKYVPVYFEGTCVMLQEEVETPIRILENHIEYSVVETRLFGFIPWVLELPHKELRDMKHKKVDCNEAFPN